LCAANTTVSWTGVSRAAGKRIDWTPPGFQYHGKRKVEPNGIVSEYRQRAEEYRKLAKLAASPEDSNLFEDIAQKWDMLADLRIGDIEPEDPTETSAVDNSIVQIVLLQSRITSAPRETGVLRRWCVVISGES
jgi:hypothetical protein